MGLSTTKEISRLLTDTSGIISVVKEISSLCTPASPTGSNWIPLYKMTWMEDPRDSFEANFGPD